MNINIKMNEMLIMASKLFTNCLLSKKFVSMFLNKCLLLITTSKQRCTKLHDAKCTNLEEIKPVGTKTCWYTPFNKPAQIPRTGYVKQNL